MATTAYVFTGIKPFWSYDSFRINNRYIGGGTGFINTCAGIVIANNVAHTVTVVTSMNLTFMVNDLMLKFHKMSPFLTRFYNSTEGLNSIDLNDHFGLLGKFWICNFEHCLVENPTTDIVVEIDPSGARNIYDGSGGGYVSPDGILKNLTMNTGTGRFELLDRNGITWYFKALGSSDPDTSTEKLYRLEKISDLSGVTIYVEWEEENADPSGSDDKWRISKIEMEDNDKKFTEVLTFGYIAMDISSSHYHFINSITDYIGNVWSYEYDTSGNLTKVVYPVDQLTHEYSYSGTSQLEIITDMNGNDWEIDYSNRTRRIEVDGSYETVTYTWTTGTSPNPVVNLSKVDEGSKTWKYNHDFTWSTAPGNLTEFIIPNNVTADYPYKYTWTKNQLTKMETPLALATSSGAFYEYTYLPGGIAGDPVAVSPPAETNNGQGNLVVSRFYDGSGYLEQYRTDYNFNNRDLLQWIGRDLQSGTYPTAVYFTKTKFEYDSDYNLIRTISGINEATSPDEEPEDASLDIVQVYEYDANGNVTKMISGNGHETTIEYDAYGAVTRRTDPGGFSVQPVWDSRHLYLTAMVDELGYVRTLKSDVLGLLLERCDSLGNVRKYVYDSNGNLLKYVEPMGNTYTKEYNEKNNVLKELSPTLIEKSYEYDSRGNRTKVTTYHNGNAFETNFTFDDSSRLTQVDYTVNSTTYQTVFYYDRDSHIINMVDPYSNTTTYAFDEYGNTTEILYPYIEFVERSVVTYRSLKVNYYYSGPMGAQDRILRSYLEDPQGGSTPPPPPSTVIDTQGETFDYDRLGRAVIHEISPDWDFVSAISNGDIKYRDTSFFNADGNLCVVERSTWTYNTSETRWEFQSSKASRYEYDNCGNKIKEIIPRDGDPVLTDDASYIITHEFDARRQEVKTEVGSEQTKVYSYDAAGRMVSSGKISKTDYLETSRLNVVVGSSSSGGGGGIITGATTLTSKSTGSLVGGSSYSSSTSDFAISNRFEYDKNGNNIVIFDGNGIKKEFQYDAENRIVAYIDGMQRVTLRNYYADSGRLKQIIKPNGDHTDYAYDVSGRITYVMEQKNNQVFEFSSGIPIGTPAVNVTYTKGTYTFDGTAFTQVSETVQYEVERDGADSYIQSFSRDKLGRIRYYHFYDDSDNGTFYEYIYDAYGNLQRITKPDGLTIEYHYDKMNRMVLEVLNPEGTGNTNNAFTYTCCRMNDFIQTESGTTLQPHEYVYDKSARLTKESYKWVSYTGEPEVVTSHDFDYQYDSGGRRQRLSDPYWSTLEDVSENPIPKFSHINYDDVGNKKSTDRSRELSESMGGGQTRKRPWAGQTFLRSGGTENFTAEFDPGGRVTRITYPGHFGEAVLEVNYSYFNDNRLKEIVARDITGAAPVEIYVIEYKYDVNGRRVRQTVWDSRDDSWPQYDAFYEYNYRDMLTEERYMKYNSTTKRMDVYRKREYTYDNGGSMTVKKIYEGDDWIQYALTYSRGYHITDWDNTISSGTVNSNIAVTYDDNGNLLTLGAVTASTLDQFDTVALTFTYDRKNRLSTYTFTGNNTRTLKWDALGRIREKTWSTNKQVFYHDGRQLVQIWDETVDGDDVTRDIAYDLYKGQTGYLKDIDFNSNPDEAGYLIKDAQGSIRAIVKVSYSGGTYTVTTDKYNTDSYGEWLDIDSAHTNGTHYMRYISCRVEDYGNPGSTVDNQALYHTDHRHYLPMLGIFLQREPLMTLPSQRSSTLSDNPNILNPYRYAENKPSIATDSSGKASGGGDSKCTEVYYRCSIEKNRNEAKCYEIWNEHYEKMVSCQNAMEKVNVSMLRDANSGIAACKIQLAQDLADCVTTTDISKRTICVYKALNRYLDCCDKYVSLKNYATYILPNLISKWTQCTYNNVEKSLWLCMDCAQIEECNCWCEAGCGCCANPWNEQECLKGWDFCDPDMLGGGGGSVVACPTCKWWEFIPFANSFSTCTLPLSESDFQKYYGEGWQQKHSDCQDKVETKCANFDFFKSKKCPDPRTDLGLSWMKPDKAVPIEIEWP
jgi:RHS repeat-associated protein